MSYSFMLSFPFLLDLSPSLSPSTPKDRLKNVTALRHLPVVLIVVVVSLTASYALGFQAMKIKVVGHVASGFVAPTIPDEPFQVFLVSAPCIIEGLASFFSFFLVSQWVGPFHRTP